MIDRKRILIILGVVWAGMIAYNAATLLSPDRGASVVKRDPTQIPRLATGLLKEERAPLSPVKRDIFSPPARQAMVKKAVSVIEAPRKEEPVSAPLPPSELKLLAGNLRFMGLLERKDGTAVFLIVGNDTVIVKEGERLNNRFRVSGISATSLSLKDDSTGDEETVDFAR